MQCVIFKRLDVLYIFSMFLFDEDRRLPEPAPVTCSISETKPVQFLCSGKSAVNKLPWTSAEVKKTKKSNVNYQIFSICGTVTVKWDNSFLYFCMCVHEFHLLW